MHREITRTKMSVPTVSMVDISGLKHSCYNTAVTIITTTIKEPLVCIVLDFPIVSTLYCDVTFTCGLD